MKDPLVKLVDDYRILRAQPRGTDSVHQLTLLTEQIIETKPRGREGVLAQIRALQDWAWADPVRRLAANLHRNVDELWPQ